MNALTGQCASGRTDSIDRLERSLADVLYAVSIVPVAWHFRVPADDPDLAWLGSWSVADNLAHLAIYEEQVAAPILEAIAAGYDAANTVSSVLESNYDSLWQELAQSPMDVIASRFSAARLRQVDTLSSMSEERFQTLATTLWLDQLEAEGHSAAWVAAKTFQHTWEHGDSILRIALFAPR